MAKRKTKAIKSKSQSSKKQTKTAKDICFTIMPFGGWMDDYYETIFCPAIESAKLIPKRADDLYRPSTIVHDIWEYTKQAKVVLANLTGKNPNVLYELGLAHAIAKPAILVTETLEDVPFDLRALRIIEYDKNSPEWGKLLQQNIEEAIKEILKAPLKSVLPAFLEVQQTQKKESLTPYAKELLELRQELDLLKRETRSRRGLPPPPGQSKMPMIGPTAARKLVSKLVSEKTPKQEIIDLLDEKGAPPNWAEREIRRIKKELE